MSPDYVVKFSVSKSSDANVVARISCGSVLVTVNGRRGATLEASDFGEQIAARFGE